LKSRTSTSTTPNGSVKAKLKVNSDWNKDLKIKFTVQDPCQIVRKSYGDPIAEDLRFVVKSVVGEENFIDMQPNRSNNFCCGGGGGFLQSGFKEQRLKYGKLKDEQIKGHRAPITASPAATTATPRSTNSASITAAITRWFTCGP
jgi:Fe-S oxidoreductase